MRMSSPASREGRLMIQYSVMGSLLKRENASNFACFSVVAKLNGQSLENILGSFRTKLLHITIYIAIYIYMYIQW
jgi:hypothetical protein